MEARVLPGGSSIPGGLRQLPGCSRLRRWLHGSQNHPRREPASLHGRHVGMCPSHPEQTLRIHLATLT